MAPQPGSSFNKMDQMQAIAVHALMAQHCKKGTDGKAVYEEGWDDDRVHREVVNPDPKRPIARNAVMNLRNKAFGNLKSANGASSFFAQTNERLTKLNARMDEIERRIADLMAYMQRRHNYVPPIGRPISTPPNANGEHQ